MISQKTYGIGSNIFQAPLLEAALYLIATPIGNLSDITLRALQTLAAVDILACEDTRVSRVLLNHYAIKQRLIAYHDHNSARIGSKLIDHLASGKSVGLICDAGTPLISDPGFKLVQEIHGLGMKVIPIPGASAVLAAVVASGLPTDQFAFVGFLPAKAGQRKTRLHELAFARSTLVFYESPHRLCKTLQDMVEVFGGDRPAAVCRELTKTFETIKLSNLAELFAAYQAVEVVRGEIVVVVGPNEQMTAVDSRDVDRLLVEIGNKLPAAKAANEVATLTGLDRKALYQRLMHLKSNE